MICGVHAGLHQVAQVGLAVFDGLFFKLHLPDLHLDGAGDQLRLVRIRIPCLCIGLDQALKAQLGHGLFVFDTGHNGAFLSEFVKRNSQLNQLLLVLLSICCQ